MTSSTCLVDAERGRRAGSGPSLHKFESALKAITGLLEKHLLWENAITEALGRRLLVDPVRDPRPRLVAAVAQAAFSTAVNRWVGSDGRHDLPSLVDDALSVAGSGLDQVGRPRS